MSEPTSEDKTAQPKPKHKPRKKAPPHVEFDVLDAGGYAHFALRNITLPEYHALELNIVGEVPEGADPKGANALQRRLLKLEQVIVSLSNIDEETYAAVGNDPMAYLRLAENRNLAWSAWDAYEGALNAEYSKSDEPVVSGGRDAQSGPQASAGGAAAA